MYNRRIIRKSRPYLAFAAYGKRFFVLVLCLAILTGIVVFALEAGDEDELSGYPAAQEESLAEGYTSINENEEAEEAQSGEEDDTENKAEPEEGQSGEEDYIADDEDAEEGEANEPGDTEEENTNNDSAPGTAVASRPPVNPITIPLVFINFARDASGREGLFLNAEDSENWDMLTGVSAFDQSGNPVAVSVLDTQFVSLRGVYPDPFFTVTYVAAHPASGEVFTRERNVYLLAEDGQTEEGEAAGEEAGIVLAHERFVVNNPRLLSGSIAEAPVDGSLRIIEVEGMSANEPIQQTVIPAGSNILLRSAGDERATIWSSAAFWRHFIVEEGATLTLQNIVLSGQGHLDVEHHHGGVDVEPGGRLYMESGSAITNNLWSYGGGVRVFDGGYLIMEAGSSISHNAATSFFLIPGGDGGGVYTYGNLITDESETPRILIDPAAAFYGNRAENGSSVSPALAAANPQIGPERVSLAPWWEEDPWGDGRLRAHAFNNHDINASDLNFFRVIYGGEGEGRVASSRIGDTPLPSKPYCEANEHDEEICCGDREVVDLLENTAITFIASPARGYRVAQWYVNDRPYAPAGRDRAWVFRETGEHLLDGTLRVHARFEPMEGAEFTFVKTEEDGESPVSNAWMHLYRWEEVYPYEGSFDWVRSAVTISGEGDPASGLVAFELAKGGRYRIVEARAPWGYLRLADHLQIDVAYLGDGQFHFALREYGDWEAFEETEAYRHVKSQRDIRPFTFIKKDEAIYRDFGQVWELQGAQFMLYRRDAESEPWEQVVEYPVTSDVIGRVSFDVWMVPGRMYKLEEIAPPLGFEEARGHWLLELRRDMDGELYFYMTPNADTVTADDGGGPHFRWQDDHWHIGSEPILDFTVPFSFIQTDGGLYDVSQDFEPLEGVTFRLFSWEHDSYLDEYSWEPVLTDPDDSSSYYESTSGPDGEVSFALSADGTYKIKEQQGLPGFSPAPGGQIVTMRGGRVQSVVPEDPDDYRALPFVEKPVYQDGDYVNAWHVGSLRGREFSFYKADQDLDRRPDDAEEDDYLLAGAQFALFRHETPNAEMEQPLGDGPEYLVPFAADDGLSSYPWVEVPLEVSRSTDGSAGAAVPISYVMDPRFTYQLVEIEAPEGYRTPRGQWRITVDEDGGMSHFNIEPIGEATTAAFRPSTAPDSGHWYMVGDREGLVLPILGGARLRDLLLIGGPLLLLLALGAGAIRFAARRRVTAGAPEQAGFREDVLSLERHTCSNCRHAVQINPERVACVWGGVMPMYGACSKFARGARRRK